MSSEGSSRRTKYDRLYAVMDRFHADLADVSGQLARRLVENWESAKQEYARALDNQAATRSQLATGIEQGLREMPELLRSMSSAERDRAMVALNTAIDAQYPEFRKREDEAVTRIRERGHIRTEAEFYLVRHRIDIAKTSPPSQVEELWALADGYEKLRR